jgi:hypothetical protein
MNFYLKISLDEGRTAKPSWGGDPTLEPGEPMLSLIGWNAATPAAMDILEVE